MKLLWKICGCRGNTKPHRNVFFVRVQLLHVLRIKHQVHFTAQQISQFSWLSLFHFFVVISVGLLEFYVWRRVWNWTFCDREAAFTYGRTAVFSVYSTDVPYTWMTYPDVGPPEKILPAEVVFSLAEMLISLYVNENLANLDPASYPAPCKNAPP